MSFAWLWWSFCMFHLEPPHPKTNPTMDPQNWPIQSLEHKPGWISSSSSPVSSLHELLDPAVTGAHRARALPAETVPPCWISGSPLAADSTRRGATKFTPTVEEGRSFWYRMVYLMVVMHCLWIHATNMGGLLNSKEQWACTEIILFVVVENWVRNSIVGSEITIQLLVCEMLAFCSPWFDLEHTRAALKSESTSTWLPQDLHSIPSRRMSFCAPDASLIFLSFYLFENSYLVLWCSLYSPNHI